MDSTAFDKYEISPEKEKSLFNDALIFFDTSALLDFYYFSEESRDEIFNKVFKPLKGRLWIAAHTEYEFLKNRSKVLRKPLETYYELSSKVKGRKDGGHLESIENILETINSKSISDLEGQIKTLKEKTSKSDKHPYLKDINYQDIGASIIKLREDVVAFGNKFKEFKDTVLHQIEEQIKTLEKSLEEDKVLEAFTEHFKSTKPFTFTEAITFLEEGELRYSNKIPPGYLDFEKVGLQKYGDLILWKQILQKGKSSNKNVILVINDLKEDWWILEQDKPTFPRHELIQEFNDITGHDFWMYDINSFIFKSSKYIDSDIEETVIEEVKNITFSQYFIDPNILHNWIYDYFNQPQVILYNDLGDAEIDFIFHNSGNLKIGIIHKTISSHLYTKLLFSIQAIYKESSNLRTTNNLDQLVLLIEYPKYDIADNYLRHLTKKSLQKILKECNNQFRIIIARNKGETMEVVFDTSF